MTDIPAHVDGVRRACLPPLLPADVLGSFHHILCCLVVSQRPLMYRYLTVLQHPNLNATTNIMSDPNATAWYFWNFHLRRTFPLSTNPCALGEANILGISKSLQELEEFPLYLTLPAFQATPTTLSPPLTLAHTVYLSHTRCNSPTHTPSPQHGIPLPHTSSLYNTHTNSHTHTLSLTHSPSL